MPPVTPADQRPAAVVLRQYDKIAAVRKQLVREGACTKEATPAQVIAALRRQVPPELFAVDEEPSK